MVWYPSDTVMALHRAKREDINPQRETSRARSAAIRRRDDVAMVRRRPIIAV